MAVATTTTTTTKLIQLRSVCLPSTTGSLSTKLFSSSSSTPDPNEDTSPHTNSTDSLPPKSSSSHSSALGDLKATLKQPQGNLQSRTPRTSFSFESSSPTARPSFNLSHKEEIIRNLSEFRRLSAVNPPPASHGSATQPGDHISLAQMYQDTVASRGEESSSASSKSLPKSISESLRRIGQINVNKPSERFAKNIDSMSLSRFKETLKLKPGDMSGRHPTKLIGGGDNLPLSVFGKEMEEGNRASANADTGEGFVKIYSHMDLGEKLKSLRPDKKGDWFSLQELNDRLMKLRQIDKENVADPRQGLYGTLRSSLINIDKGISKRNQFFHPDNMSASEKLKLELGKLRDEFKMSDSDCGSARVQVAQLTTKIKHLATVLHKKDKHSRKGLLGMVQKRKTLLKYLRRTDWESYCFVLSKLGLRDNPDYKN